MATQAPQSVPASTHALPQQEPPTQSQPSNSQHLTQQETDQLKSAFDFLDHARQQLPAHLFQSLVTLLRDIETRRYSRPTHLHFGISVAEAWHRVSTNVLKDYPHLVTEFAQFMPLTAAGAHKTGRDADGVDGGRRGGPRSVRSTRSVRSQASTARAAAATALLSSGGASGFRPQHDDANNLQTSPVRGSRINRDQSPTDFNRAVGFVTTVKDSFADEPDIYSAFIDTLRAYHQGTQSPAQVASEVVRLFGERRDLIRGFFEFLPESARSLYRDILSDDAYPHAVEKREMTRATSSDTLASEPAQMHVSESTPLLGAETNRIQTENQSVAVPVFEPPLGALFRAAHRRQRHPLQSCTFAVSCIGWFMFALVLILYLFGDEITSHLSGLFPSL